MGFSFFTLLIHSAYTCSCNLLPNGTWTIYRCQGLHTYTDVEGVPYSFGYMHCNNISGGCLLLVHGSHRFTMHPHTISLRLFMVNGYSIYITECNIYGVISMVTLQATQLYPRPVKGLILLLSNHICTF